MTRGWNGHRIGVSTTKLTLEKKILPPLLPGFELATFRSRARRPNQQAIPAAYDTCHFSLEEDGESMELNEPGRQKLELLAVGEACEGIF